MLRNQLISMYRRLNLMKSCDLILLNQRTIHRSSIVLNKHSRKQPYGDDHTQDHNYVARNDSLLSLNEIFKEINKEDNKPKKKNKMPNKCEPNKMRPTRLDPVVAGDQMENQLKSDLMLRYDNRFPLDGKNLINDAIMYGCPRLIRIYYSEDDKLNKINEIDKLREDGVQFHKVDYELMKKYSNVITPQGIIGIGELDVDQLFETNMEKNQNEVPLILVLNDVKDPGNLGTLIRSSLACGITKILCLKGCAKMLKDKVIRSTAGSVFHVPFVENLRIKDLEHYLPDNAKFYLSDSKGTNLDPNLRFLLEDNGDDDKEVSSTDEIETDAKVKTDSVDQSTETVEDKATTNMIDQTPVVNQSMQDIQTLDYTDVDYFSSKEDCIVLIANGEVGTSSKILELVKSRNGVKINIPLANSVDSLNTSVAASILIYEIRRQYLKKFQK